MASARALQRLLASTAEAVGREFSMAHRVVSAGASRPQPRSDGPDRSARSRFLCDGSWVKTRGPAASSPRLRTAQGSPAAARLYELVDRVRRACVAAADP